MKNVTEFIKVAREKSLYDIITPDKIAPIATPKFSPAILILVIFFTISSVPRL